jgi:NADP-dependent alcohol dehydrogenase
MIGHEITALFGIDHARSLAIIQPAVWKIRKKQKRDKLLQYGERVWGITEGDEESRINAAINKTEEFFQSLGMKTRLNEHSIDESGIQKILKSLEKHGMTALSETGDITLEVSKEILLAAR